MALAISSSIDEFQVVFNCKLKDNMDKSKLPLRGKVAIVTGASRGVGKGVALGLGEAGATVYVTGRTLAQGASPFPGDVNATADEVSKMGGTGIAVQCDHADDDAVAELIEKVMKEQARCDILVNNVFGAPDKMPTDQPFWQIPLSLWDTLHRVGLRSHYVASRLVAPIMVQQGSGLIVNTSSGGAVRYTFNVPFGAQKAAVDKMAKDMAHDLKPFGVTAVALWPGFIKSEKLLAQPDRLPPALMKRILENGETSLFAGRAVAALAADENVIRKTGQVLLAAELAEEYGFTDIDGRVPPAPARQ
jgi:dehydrogenase/reductase SDR family member 1